MPGTSSKKKETESREQERQKERNRRPGTKMVKKERTGKLGTRTVIRMNREIWNKNGKKKEENRE